MFHSGPSFFAVGRREMEREREGREREERERRDIEKREKWRERQTDFRS